jgi:transposase
VCSVPMGTRENVSLLAGLRLDGVVAPLAIRGPIDGNIFLQYMRDAVGVELTEGDVVVMDRLSAHKVAGVKEAIESRGAKLVYLPPYSPELNPIEECWSKVKAWLRKAGARTFAALIEAFADALSLVSPDDIRGWFAHAGYPP